MAVKIEKEFHHPLIIRLSHWINLIALGIMVTSGLRIYNAAPLYSFFIPRYFTLGGWLAGARQWHFFAMWIFAANGVIYVLYNIFSKHGRHTTLFRGADVKGVLPMIKYYLRIRKEHPPQKKYNPLQKLTYTLIPLLGLGSILSGMALYWPTQFSWITAMFVNYDYARGFHFLFTMGFVGFTAGHLVMV
ncbi:MAG TPA: cytochrome b/b6 domain-containing protein, partial [Bacteroidota bacterium]|nr:cytochrome b/b6 domain-containing protein [Bacteroidota bacterium]